MKAILSIGIYFSEPAFGILITCFSFILYWLISRSKIISPFVIRKFGEKRSLIYKVVFEKLSGFLFLGFIPALIISLTSFSIFNYGINFSNLTLSFYWIISLGLIIFILSLLISRNPNNYKIYPQIRLKEWGKKTIFLNSSAWIVYLLGYEFLFRGILLFSCLHTMDLITSVAINVIIYAIAHIPKGIMETIGSIPIGILLCYITISTGSIWSAFVLHVIMALSNDYISLYFNPEMKFIKSN